MLTDTFLQFVKRVGVKLTSAQRVLCAVAFDGTQPSRLRSSDREVARRIFGDIDEVPPEAREVLCAVCGARAGKTYVLIALRMLHLALTVDLASLAPGEVASGIIVAPDMRLARQALRYVSGAVDAVPALKPLVSGQSTDSISIARDGHAVVIECLPATRGGSAVRGRSLVGAGLDEAAFFRDADYRINDEEVFKALAPRVMPGGQLVIASTPWAEAGLLHSLFEANHGRPSTSLAAHAPTTLLRDDIRTRAMVARERLRDPDNAAREFDAEFMSAGTGQFFDPLTIDASIDRSRPLALEHPPGGECSIGADLAFNSDHSACVAVFGARTADGSDIFVLADLLELRPEKGKPLKPSEVVAQFSAFAKARGSSALVADGHYKESAREHLEEHGLLFVEAPGGQTGKVATYLKTRALFNDRKIRVPNYPRLVNQLKAVVSKPTPGGGLSISSPRRGAGGHGDIASAFVLALYHAAESGYLWTPSTLASWRSVTSDFRVAMRGFYPRAAALSCSTAIGTSFHTVLDPRSGQVVRAMKVDDD